MQAKVIRRYANRKLYDTETSQYTTLKKIVEEVTSGRDVQVLDNSSKEDITASTLLMAIVETSDNNVDVNTLANILRAGGITNYVNSTLTTKPTGV